MKDTDLITLNLTITLRQARYLRRKLHDCAKAKQKEARRALHLRPADVFIRLEDDSMMLEGLAAYLENKIEQANSEH